MARAISLKELRDFLYPIRLKWYDLGIELDIPGEELDEIKSKNRDDYGACLRDMIAARLKFKDDPLTWGHLEDALNARAINEPQLAEKAKEYGLLEAQTSIFVEAIKTATITIPVSNRSLQPCEAQPSWKFTSRIKKYTITELPCYHGAMRGVDAEKKLKQQPGDSHLVRYSDSQGEYILSVLKRSTDESIICQHFVINTTPNTSSLHPSSLYSVKGSDMVFNDASKMLEYFKENPISYEISGIGEHCFATPPRPPEIPPRSPEIPQRSPETPQRSSETPQRSPEVPRRSPEQKIEQLDTSLNLYNPEGTTSATSPEKTTSEKNTRQEETTSAMHPEEPTSEKNTRPEETTSEKNTRPEETTSEISTRKRSHRRWCIIL